MSYKVNEIHQIESVANKCGLNNYTYLSGFEFKGEKYSLGWVTLNEEGMKKLKTKNPRVEITQHWILPNGTHAYCVKFYKEIQHGKLRGFWKWDDIFLYNTNFDEYCKCQYKNAQKVEYKNVQFFNRSLVLLSIQKGSLFPQAI